MEKNKTTQEKFDDLIKSDGAEAVIEAIKAHHIKPDTGGCTATSCPTGYYCDNGVCVLDVGH